MIFFLVLEWCFIIGDGIFRLLEFLDCELFFRYGGGDGWCFVSGGNFFLYFCIVMWGNIYFFLFIEEEGFFVRFVLIVNFMGVGEYSSWWRFLFFFFCCFWVCCFKSFFWFFLCLFFWFVFEVLFFSEIFFIFGFRFNFINFLVIFIWGENYDMLLLFILVKFFVLNFIGWWYWIYLLNVINKFWW